MEKKYKVNVEGTSELVSKEVIEALLEVLEEDNLQPVDNNRHNDNGYDYKVYYGLPDKGPYFIVNDVKLKNTAECRMIEIVNSINPNTVKSVELILSNSVDCENGIDLFLFIGNMGYCVVDISIRSYAKIKSILLEEDIEVVETMLCFDINEDGEISDKKITFENKLIKRSVE